MKTDLELQLALAKMLPEKIYEHDNQIFWQDGQDFDEEICRPVSDTELLHVCWLIEQGLTPAQKVQYAEVLAAETEIVDWGYYPGESTIDWLGVATVATASWQQRASALIALKGEK